MRATLRRESSSAMGSRSGSADRVHLVLANAIDTLTAAVVGRLHAADHVVALFSHPFAAPHRCSWYLDDADSVCEHMIKDVNSQGTVDVAAVLVRDQPVLDPTGWGMRDLAYAQSELHAAVLGWLQGQACPVVNRFPSWIWFRRGARLSDWYPALRAAGLPFQDARLTNDAACARAFGDDLVLNSMTSEAAFLVSGEVGWQSLSKFLSRTPAQLTRPHGEPRFATVVGPELVWSESSRETTSLDPALHRFASLTGLAFFEVAVAPVDGGLQVVAVDAFPTLEHQPVVNHTRIVDALVSLMTGATSAAAAGRLR